MVPGMGWEYQPDMFGFNDQLRLFEDLSGPKEPHFRYGEDDERGRGGPAVVEGSPRGDDGLPC